MIPERLRPILDEVRPLAQRFDAAGHRLYLVGGIVRDARARPAARPATSTSPPTPAPSAPRRSSRGWADAVWDQGARFGTVGLKKGDTRVRDHHPPGRGLRPRLPQARRRPSPTQVEADLSRRDFTVNAMALRVTGADGEAPELIDPFGGVADLAAGVLRTPLSPEESFTDDPAADAPGGPLHRRLRARARRRRSSPRCASMVGRLEIVSAERIRDELSQAARGRRPDAPGCGSSSTPGSPTSSCPSCPAMRVEQDPIHRHKDVLAHTIAVVAKTQPAS